MSFFWALWSVPCAKTGTLGMFNAMNNLCPAAGISSTHWTFLNRTFWEWECATFSALCAFQVSLNYRFIAVATELPDIQSCEIQPLNRSMKYRIEIRNTDSTAVNIFNMGVFIMLTLLLRRRTLFLLKLGSLQYAIMKTVLCVLSIVLWTNGNFDPSDVSNVLPSTFCEITLHKTYCSAKYTVLYRRHGFVTSIVSISEVLWQAVKVVPLLIYVSFFFFVSLHSAWNHRSLNLDKPFCWGPYYNSPVACRHHVHASAKHPPKSQDHPQVRHVPGLSKTILLTAID